VQRLKECREAELARKSASQGSKASKAKKQELAAQRELEKRIAAAQAASWVPHVRQWSGGPAWA
jgi:hypothetical protein